MKWVIDSAQTQAPDGQSVEIVERKGLGHPDSICDALAEEFSLELSRFYLERTGRILHHNVDKVLLAAGSSRARFGGGTVDEPMQIILAGRATASCAGIETPIAELAELSVRRWLDENLPRLDARRPPLVSSLVRPGSTELVDLFEDQTSAQVPLSNDTSCGVGYAPLSEVEGLVLAIEQGLNSAEARAQQPAIGADIKVMAFRQQDGVDLTLSCAMIDRSLQGVADYAKAVEDVADLAWRVARERTSLPITLRVNAADDLDQGRVFLTVTGTSAEAGDDGQAGRGNRANGLITPGRTMTIESTAGKNPVTHVGKLYNVVASLAAERLVNTLSEVSGAECRLVSQIGQPIDEPQLIDVRLRGVDAQGDRDLLQEVERIVGGELEQLPTLAERFLSGRLRLNRWPMEQ